jgi:hypothetical protein
MRRASEDARELLTARARWRSRDNHALFEETLAYITMRLIGDLQPGADFTEPLMLLLAALNFTSASALQIAIEYVLHAGGCGHGGGGTREIVLARISDDLEGMAI